MWVVPEQAGALPRTARTAVDGLPKAVGPASANSQARSAGADGRPNARAGHLIPGGAKFLSAAWGRVVPPAGLSPRREGVSRGIGMLPTACHPADRPAPPAGHAGRGLHNAAVDGADPRLQRRGRLALPVLIVLARTCAASSGAAVALQAGRRCGVSERVFPGAPRVQARVSATRSLRHQTASLHLGLGSLQ